VVQTLHEDEPAIVFASRHDVDGFVRWEMPLRQQAHLPPASRMVRLLVRHAKLERAEQGAQLVAGAVRKLLGHLPAGQVGVIGPQPAAVKRIRNQFRFELLLLSNQPGQVQHILVGQMEALQKLSQAELLADADPLNLL
jgi:primosomal protein N' (replication factor Y)